MQNEKEENQAKESQPEYKSDIMIFNSFEEMNEFDHRNYAALTPIESLSHVTLMRLTRFPYLNTNLNPWGDTIYIDK